MDGSFYDSQLELYHSYNPNAVTLLDVIDKTLSPMGGRLLKRWLVHLKRLLKCETPSGGGFIYKKIRRFCIKMQNQIKQISD
jgi:DNA mismatch repair protein MutS